MRLPLCAWCGESMTERARRSRADGGMMMLDHPHTPTRPRYGWHGDCAKLDPLGWPMFAEPSTTPLAELVAAIEARGPGRVVTRRGR